MKAIESKIGLFFVLWLLLLTGGPSSHAATLSLEEHSEETITDSYPHQYHFEQIEIASIPQSAQDELTGFNAVSSSEETHAVLSALSAEYDVPILEDLRRFLKIRIYPFHCFW